MKIKFKNGGIVCLQKAGLIPKAIKTFSKIVDFENPINWILNGAIESQSHSFKDKFYKTLIQLSPDKDEVISSIPRLLDGNPNSEELSHLLTDQAKRWDTRFVPWGFHLDTSGNIKVTPGNAAEQAKTYLGIEKGRINPDLPLITRSKSSIETLGNYNGSDYWMGGFSPEGLVQGYHLGLKPKVPGVLQMRSITRDPFILKKRGDALDLYRENQIRKIQKAISANDPENAAASVIDLLKVPKATDYAYIQRLQHAYTGMDAATDPLIKEGQRLDLAERINPATSSDVTRAMKRVFKPGLERPELIVPDKLSYDIGHSIYTGDAISGKSIGGYYLSEKPIDILPEYEMNKWDILSKLANREPNTKYFEHLKQMQEKGYPTSEIEKGHKATTDLTFKSAGTVYPHKPVIVRVNDYGGLFYPEGVKDPLLPRMKSEYFKGVKTPGGDIPIVLGVPKQDVSRLLYEVDRFSPEYKNGGQI